MKTSTASLSTKARVIKMFAEARFFSFSALIHLGLIVFLSGYVIITNMPKDEAVFTPTETYELINDPETTSEPDDQPKAITPDNDAGSPQTGPLENVINTQKLITTIGPSSLVMFNGADNVNRLGDSLLKAGERAMKDGMGGPGSSFGTKPSGNGPAAGLVGTFYDLKQTRTKSATNVDSDEYQKIFRRYIREGWKETTLENYFKAPTKLYTTQLFIPNMKASEGPKAFGVEKEVEPSRWLAVYKGRVSPPESGTYHFVGGGDDVLVVRFNGKVVLDRCWRHEGSDWKPVKNYDYGFTNIPNGFAKGDAIHVKAGQFYDIEILIGEQPGSYFYSCLLIEKDGGQYEKDAKGNPIVPVFRLMDRSIPALQEGETLPPYQKGGPVWKAAPNSVSALSLATSSSQ